jgi:dynamin 1-like protein
LSEQDILTAIKNSQALSPSLFVPEGAFEVLIRQQIARLLDPALECAQKVYQELRVIVSKIEIEEVNRYQRLKYKICDVMENLLDKCLTPTTDMIVQLIEIENAHINTNHPDFVKESDVLLGLFSTD